MLPTLKAITGQTNYTAELFTLAGVRVGSAITLIENNSADLPGIYTGSVPNNTPPGEYLVAFKRGSVTIATTNLYWNGEKEPTNLLNNQLLEGDELRSGDTYRKRIKGTNTNLLVKRLTTVGDVNRLEEL